MKRSLTPPPLVEIVRINVAAHGSYILYCKTVIFERPTSGEGNAMENESSRRNGGREWVGG